MTDADSPFLEPPFSAELLADLDAGVLDPYLAAYIRSRIADDPAAQETLAVLVRLRGELRSLPVSTHPVPGWVDARTQQTLAAIRDEVSGRPPPGNPAAAATDVRPLRRRRSIPSSPQAVGLLSLAAAILVAVVVGVILLARPTDAGSGPHHAQPDRTSTPAASGAAAALSVLGHTDSAPFASRAALLRCTAANAVPSSTPVLGSGPVVIDGTPRAVILLGTGVAGRFLALVVDPTCDTGNPATISRTVIGG
ncbi:hypothetical protein ACLQ3C_12325 [Gordonia sp. DT30]|uniref:hypothetical protein n=1 Tax=Gordonia sp. DT30 TaxID=3416546 RepID=UPI003CF8DDEB